MKEQLFLSRPWCLHCLSFQLTFPVLLQRSDASLLVRSSLTVSMPCAITVWSEDHNQKSTAFQSLYSLRHRVGRLEILLKRDLGKADTFSHTSFKTFSKLVQCTEASKYTENPSARHSCDGDRGGRRGCYSGGSSQHNDPAPTTSSRCS